MARHDCSSVWWVGRLIFDLGGRGVIRPPLPSSVQGRTPATPHRLIHEPRAIPDFHGGIRGIRDQFVGRGLRQIARRAIDEVIAAT
jgi:hypothetical protein